LKTAGNALKEWRRQIEEVTMPQIWQNLSSKKNNNDNGLL
jgi:hypothetical protein